MSLAPRLDRSPGVSPELENWLRKAISGTAEDRAGPKTIDTIAIAKTRR
jgi:hypothetical protein